MLARLKEIPQVEQDTVFLNAHEWLLADGALEIAGDAGGHEVLVRALLVSPGGGAE